MSIIAGAMLAGLVVWFLTRGDNGPRQAFCFWCADELRSNKEHGFVHPDGNYWCEANDLWIRHPAYPIF